MKKIIVLLFVGILLAFGGCSDDDAKPATDGGTDAVAVEAGTDAAIVEAGSDTMGEAIVVEDGATASDVGFDAAPVDAEVPADDAEGE